jgi:YegS/Rv2252/BmrU family lipid kinase
MNYRQATLIYNPTSGRRRSIRERQVRQAQEELKRFVPRVEVQATSSSGDATALAARAVQEGSDLIAACGGDGTINEVVTGMVGSDASLLALPSGTANVLAFEVGLPKSVVKVAKMLPDLRPYRVPLGIVQFQKPKPGFRYFLLMCGIGVDASIVYNLDTRLKALIGQGAYFWGSLGRLQQPFESFRVTIDGHEKRCTLVVISKSRRYGGGLILTPEAHLLSQEFQVVLFEGDTPLRYIGYLARVATNSLHHFPDVHFWHTTRVELDLIRQPKIHIEVDGELAGRIPGYVEMTAETLNLLLPPAYAARHENKMRSDEQGKPPGEPPAGLSW